MLILKTTLETLLEEMKKAIRFSFEQNLAGYSYFYEILVEITNLTSDIYSYVSRSFQSMKRCFL